MVSGLWFGTHPCHSPFFKGALPCEFPQLEFVVDAGAIEAVIEIFKSHRAPPLPLAARGGSEDQGSRPFTARKGSEDQGSRPFTARRGSEDQAPRPLTARRGGEDQGPWQSAAQAPGLAVAVASRAAPAAALQEAPPKGPQPALRAPPVMWERLALQTEASELLLDIVKESPAGAERGEQCASLL